MANKKYKTTVTEKDGTQKSGYIENGRSYYDDGKEINAGASVVDAQGKTWTKGGSTETKTTPSYNDTWEANGRTYVGGVDVGPAGTTVDTTNSASNINTAIGVNNSGGGSSSNPYEKYYRDAMDNYGKLNEQAEEMNRLAVEQGVNRLEAQKQGVEQAAEDSAREAYIMQMQNERVLPQQLAYKGANGGQTETAKIGIQTNYENNVNNINRTKINAIQEIDNAIADLKTTGDLKTVEQVLANNKAALDTYMTLLDKGVGYNQWAMQYTADRIDKADANRYRDQAYRDSMALQEIQNGLDERAMALKEQEYAYNKAKDEEETARKIADEKLATNYYNLATNINQMYSGNTVGKESGVDVIVNDGMGGYTINPNISRSSYLDLIIARALDSNMSDEEVKEFLHGLDINDAEISRVASYYLK
jgi:hypothetical protein